MPWDKFVTHEFISKWTRLSLAEKRLITEAMATLSVNPAKYQPTPVRLMSGDLLIAVLHYWIHYRLDERRRRILFIRLRTD